MGNNQVFYQDRYLRVNRLQQWTFRQKFPSNASGHVQKKTPL